MLEQKDIEYGQFSDESRLTLVEYRPNNDNVKKPKFEAQPELLQLMRFHLHAEF